MQTRLHIIIKDPQLRSTEFNVFKEFLVDEASSQKTSITVRHDESLLGPSDFTTFPWDTCHAVLVVSDSFL
jgi:hypothetical protein